MVGDTPESRHLVEYACYPLGLQAHPIPEHTRAQANLTQGWSRRGQPRNGNKSDQSWSGRDSLAAGVMHAPRKGAGSIEASTGQSDQSGRNDPEREHAFLALPLVPDSGEAGPLEIVSHGRAVSGGKSRLSDLRDDGVD